MKILGAPLVQFVVLGALLFVVHSFGSRLLADDASHRIEVGATEIQFMVDNWSGRWQRPPTVEELRTTVNARVQQEILYREALRVGLDTNDAVVRQRMVQKMEMLSEDLALLADPTDQELRGWWKENAEDHRLPPQLSFSHIYFNPDLRGPTVEEDMARILEGLHQTDPPVTLASELGDRFMLGYEYTGYTPAQVQREYGSQFAEVLFELEPGWQGPVLSGFGMHLVYVGERVEGRDPEFAEVRHRLVMDYNRMRRERSRNMLHETLRGRYEVEIDEAEIQRLGLVVP